MKIVDRITSVAFDNGWHADANGNIWYDSNALCVRLTIPKDSAYLAKRYLRSKSPLDPHQIIGEWIDNMVINGKTKIEDLRAFVREAERAADSGNRIIDSLLEAL